MKGRNLSVISAVVLLVGLAVIFAHRSIHSQGIVITGGALFILAGVFNVLSFDVARKRNKDGRGAVSSIFNWIGSAAAVILGLFMLVFQPTFVTMVPVMFGILIAFAAFYQLYVLAIAIRPVTLSPWFYIVPVLLALAAVYMFVQEPAYTSDASIMLTTGISLSFFGIAGIVEGSLVGSAHRKEKAAAKTESEKKTTPLDDTAVAPADAHTEAPNEPISESKADIKQEN